MYDRYFALLNSCWRASVRSGHQLIVLVIYLLYCLLLVVAVGMARARLKHGIKRHGYNRATIKVSSWLEVFNHNLN